MSAPCILALVTAPDLECARALARGAVNARLAACASILPGLESHYRWEGKVEQAAEVQILFKSTVAMLPQLQSYVESNHPYDTPEFIVLQIEQGSERYLAWLSSCVGPQVSVEGTAGAGQSPA